jgi:hypothetical protein
VTPVCFASCLNSSTIPIERLVINIKTSRLTTATWRITGDSPVAKQMPTSTGHPVLTSMSLHHLHQDSKIPALKLASSSSKSTALPSQIARSARHVDDTRIGSAAKVACPGAYPHLYQVHEGGVTSHSMLKISSIMALPYAYVCLCSSR